MYTRSTLIDATRTWVLMSNSLANHSNRSSSRSSKFDSHRHRSPIPPDSLVRHPKLETHPQHDTQEPPWEAKLQISTDLKDPWQAERSNQESIEIAKQWAAEQSGRISSPLQAPRSSNGDSRPSYTAVEGHSEPHPRSQQQSKHSRLECFPFKRDGKCQCGHNCDGAKSSGTYRWRTMPCRDEAQTGKCPRRARCMFLHVRIGYGD